MSPIKRKQSQMYTSVLVSDENPSNKNNDNNSRLKKRKVDPKLESSNCEELRQKEPPQVSITPNKEANDLNQRALLMFTIGDFDEAELLLKEALNFSGALSIQGLFNKTEKSFNSGSNPSPNKDNRIRSIIFQSSNINAISNPPQQEYDEGMNLLSTPIEIANACTWDDTLKAAALQYNIGQTYIKRRNYLVGIDWFHSAMQTYENICDLSLLNDSIDIMIKIIDALAYSYYRKELYDDAIKFYEVAEKYISSAKVVSNYLAYIKNSLAVVLFRKEAAEISVTATSSKTNTVTATETDTNTDNVPTTSARPRQHITALPITTEMKSIALFNESLALYKAMYETKENTKHQSSSKSNIVNCTATVYNNLGRAYYLIGNYQQALICFELALTKRRGLIGTNSIDLAVTICNLAQTHHHLEHFDEALSYFNEFLAIADGALIDDGNISQSKQNNAFVTHPDLTIVAGSVASIYLGRNQLQEAKNMYEMALNSGRVAFGDTHTEVAHILNKLGSTCYKLRQFDLSLSYLQEGLAIEQKIYGGKHPNVVVTLLNIAQIHRDRDMYESALIFYGQAHRIISVTKGRESIDACDTLLSMGLMLYRMKSFSSAFDSYQEALYVQRKQYGEDNDHIAIASTLNSLAIVVFHLGEPKLAISYFEESLRMRRQLFGENHPDIAVNLFNLAKLYLELHDTEKASELYKETLKIERATQGRLSDEVLQTLQRLGLLHQQNGELLLALQYFSEALELEQEKYKGVKSPRAAKLLTLIGNIHLQRANAKEMMKCFVAVSRICDGNIDAVVIAGYNFYSISTMHPECAATA